MSKMAALDKLSIDALAMFITRSANSSPSQSGKNGNARRSRSHGSSPVPRRVQLSRASSSDDQLSDGRSAFEASQSPIFTRVSGNSQDDFLDGSGDSPSLSNTDDENRGRRSYKRDDDSQNSLEKKQKKKSSLVKDFLVNRLRSGSWHASSRCDHIRNSVDRLHTNSSNNRERRKFVTDTRLDSTEQSNGDKELAGLIQHVLDSHLWNESYDCKRASAKCGMLSKVLEKAVKSRLTTDTKKYKISALVYLGEIKEDGIKMATQCAWEPTQDYFAMATYESEQLFASAMVFAAEFDDGKDSSK